MFPLDDNFVFGDNFFLWADIFFLPKATKKITQPRKKITHQQTKLLIQRKHLYAYDMMFLCQSCLKLFREHPKKKWSAFLRKNQQKTIVSAASLLRFQEFFNLAIHITKI